MLLPRWNRNGITHFHLAGFALNPHAPAAVSDVINFLRPDMVMLLRAAADRQARLSQALVANGGIAMRQQFPDFRAVLGGKRRDLVQILDVHARDYNFIGCARRCLKVKQLV